MQYLDLLIKNSTIAIIIVTLIILTGGTLEGLTKKIILIILIITAIAITTKIEQHYTKEVNQWGKN